MAPRTMERGARRAALVAATRQFAAHGVDRTSVADIVRAALVLRPVYELDQVRHGLVLAGRNQGLAQPPQPLHRRQSSEPKSRAKTAMSRLHSLLEQIIVAGVAEGSFKVDDPMWIVRDPLRAASLGLIGVRANLAGLEAGWPSFGSYLTAIAGPGGPATWSSRSPSSPGPPRLSSS